MASVSEVVRTLVRLDDRLTPSECADPTEPYVPHTSSSHMNASREVLAPWRSCKQNHKSASTPMCRIGESFVRQSAVYHHDRRLTVTTLLAVRVTSLPSAANAIPSVT